MKKIFHKAKSLIHKVRGLFPSQLPTGVDDFNAYILSILDIYSIPHEKSYFSAIATMIMHLPPTCHKKSKFYFAKSIRKAQSNQVAYEIIMRNREEQKTSKDIEAVSKGDSMNEPGQKAN